MRGLSCRNRVSCSDSYHEIVRSRCGWTYGVGVELAERHLAGFASRATCADCGPPLALTIVEDVVCWSHGKNVSRT